jgi:hypothetical protein
LGQSRNLGLAPKVFLAQWPKEDIQAHIGFMIGLNKELKEAGELVSAEGLAWPDQAKLVRAGKDGTPITDGIFPESKEFLIGYCASGYLVGAFLYRPRYQRARLVPTNYKRRLPPFTTKLAEPAIRTGRRSWRCTIY